MEVIAKFSCAFLLWFRMDSTKSYLLLDSNREKGIAK